jgi:hypothetical protein
MEVYDTLREKFGKLLEENHLESEETVISAKPLTPEEVIGDPEDRTIHLLSAANA